MNPLIDPTTTYRGLRRQILDAGGSHGAPPGVDAEAREIDRQCVADLECEACGLVRNGGNTMRCFPFTDADGQYVAVAACPCCGWATEF